VLADLLGERVDLAANDELAIDVDRPGQIRIEFPRERFSDQAAARRAVEQQAGQVIEAPGDAVDPGSLALVVTFPPERRDQALQALGEMDRRLHIRPAHTTHKARVADLGATAEAIVVKTAGDRVADLPGRPDPRHRHPGRRPDPRRRAHSLSKASGRASISSRSSSRLSCSALPWSIFWPCAAGRLEEGIMIRLHDTRAKKKVEFQPLEPRQSLHLRLRRDRCTIFATWVTRAPRLRST
jgi:hypothetical protein